MEVGFPPGTVLMEKYRVEGELGRGGMGVVLRVTHLHLGEELAIKILSPDAAGGPEAHARFLREAQSAVRLRGEHVARVGDVGTLAGGAPYMVMEYLRGGDLSGELGRRGVLPPGELVDYVLQACEALAEAHAIGIVHRDIKPSNLFLTRRPDGSPLVKVLDFGISKAPIGGPGVLTRTDTVMGTPGYMSPEQMKASKDVDPRSDIWGLGIVLYECLNGRRPFDAETFSATVLRAATEPPPPMDSRVPRGLQAAILRCLEKDRTARFPSTAVLAAALAPFAKDARSAGIIVERTAAMLQGSGAQAAPATRFGQSPHATTLSGSAGMMRARTTRRYAIGGVGVIITAAIAIAVVAQTTSHTDASAQAGESGSVARPITGADAAVAIGVSEPAHAVSSAPDAAAVTAAVTADAAIVPAVPETAVAAGPATAHAEVIAKVQQCAELEVNQRWQELRECAATLDTLATRDRTVAPKADAFRHKAVEEAASSTASVRVKEAISESNLREAQKQLKTIAVGSVYFPAASEALRAAETRATEDNRQKALALAAKNDCAGVNRLQAQLAATGTSSVVGAVAGIAAKCVARDASPPPDAAVGAAGGSSTVGAAGGSSTVGAAGGSSTVSASDDHVPAPPGFCEAMKLDDAMSQAQNQYQAGFPSAALRLLTKVTACRHDVRIYRMAGFYACAAHDAEAAKLYYAKVPAQYQASIAQRCQQENILIPASIP